MNSTIEQQVASLHRQAEQAIERHAYKEAHACCARILSLEPGHADAHFLMGMIAFAQRQVAKALALIDRAIARVPDRAEYFARRGQCLALMNRHAEALEAATRALDLEPKDALTLDTIGVVLSRAGRYETAAEVLASAVEARPTDPQFRFNLASCHLFLGNLEQAAACYEAAVKLRPTFYRAHWALADVATATPQHNHIERLERLLENAGANVDGCLYLSHALAKELEDLGEHVQALDCLIEANARKRAHIGYSSNNDHDLFEAMHGLFTSSFVSRANAGDPSRRPIFVVGMPRTGTTLVERILSSHSEVSSAGELQDFGLALKRASGSRSNLMLDVDTINKAAGSNFLELGQRYLATAGLATRDTPHFVDKMPMNFLYIGFIHLALPNAKIVCLRRHPLDTCVSNFRQLFRLEHSYYAYAYDLSDIAQYYIMFARLMSHWEELLPGKVLQVQYEQLVEDQEQQIRRLLEFCELDWEQACFDFHLNEAPIATASAAQVRQPIHAGSIGRYKRYGDRLEPIRRQLSAAGIGID
jgi:tetratricopeptide (TPR) repeat protein